MALCSLSSGKGTEAKRGTMKTAVVSGLALILLTSVGFSQAELSGRNANTESSAMDTARARAVEEQKKQRALDDAYKDAVARTKSPASRPDPWGNVRPANGSAANK
jgi:hypothetical protein